MRTLLYATTTTLLTLACSSGAPSVQTSSSSSASSRSSAAESSSSSAQSSSRATSSASTSAAFDAGYDGSTPHLDGAPTDASEGEAGDASDACEVYGAPGECITTTACSSMSAYTSYAGHCPGPSTIECCIVTPNTANNPPTPAGYELMPQSQVTAAMTAWAVMILDDPTDYPMFGSTLMTFGTQMVLARVEWHPPDFQNSVVHRGVTLYEPI